MKQEELTQQDKELLSIEECQEADWLLLANTAGLWLGQKLKAAKAEDKKPVAVQVRIVY